MPLLKLLSDRLHILLLSDFTQNIETEGDINPDNHDNIVIQTRHYEGALHAQQIPCQYNIAMESWPS